MEILKPIFENIPDELKGYPQWVAWKAEARDEKVTKPPHMPHGGYAKSDDPHTWSAFDAVKKSMDRFDGVGFVLTGDDPFVGLDFDSCYCPAFNLIDPAIEKHLKALDTYSEKSPSGRGLRLLLKGTLPVSGKKNGRTEAYRSGRYVTITGHLLNGYPRTIEPRQKELDKFYRDVFPDRTGERERRSAQSVVQWKERLDRAFQSKTGYEISRLWRGDFSNYPSQSEADLALCSYLAFWLSGDEAAIDEAFRESGLYREKWNRKHYADGRTYGQGVIEEAVRGCKNYYTDAIDERTALQDKPSLEKSEDPQSIAFPDIMRGAAGDFAALYAQYLEVPQHFFYISFLTCLGSALSGTLNLSTEIRPQPRLYTILLGESADDRKSTGISKTVDFFRETLKSFNVSYGVGSAEGLQDRLKTETYEPSRLLLVFDEFKQFVSKCKIEASVLLPCVNTLYEGNRYESRTKNSAILIEDAHLTLLAASTVSTYERTWDNSFTDIGFNNRLFLVPGSGKKRFSFPAKIPDIDKAKLKKRVGDLMAFVGQGRELDISLRGREMYDDWYMTLEKSIHTKRLDGYALRFMALMAVNEEKEIIDEDTVADAITLVNWQLEVRRLHDPIDSDSLVGKTEEKIRRLLHSGAKSERELKRSIHVNRIGLWPFLTALKNLQAGHEIRWNRIIKKYELTDDVNAC